MADAGVSRSTKTTPHPREWGVSVVAGTLERYRTDNNGQYLEAEWMTADEAEKFGLRLIQEAGAARDKNATVQLRSVK